MADGKQWYCVDRKCVEGNTGSVMGGENVTPFESREECMASGCERGRIASELVSKVPLGPVRRPVQFLGSICPTVLSDKVDDVLVAIRDTPIYAYPVAFVKSMFSLVQLIPVHMTPPQAVKIFIDALGIIEGRTQHNSPDVAWGTTQVVNFLMYTGPGQVLKDLFLLAPVQFITVIMYLYTSRDKKRTEMFLQRLILKGLCLSSVYLRQQFADYMFHTIFSFLAVAQFNLFTRISEMVSKEITPKLLRNEYVCDDYLSSGNKCCLPYDKKKHKGKKKYFTDECDNKCPHLAFCRGIIEGRKQNVIKGKKRRRSSGKEKKNNKKAKKNK